MKRSANEIASALKRGWVVALPTDTVYGLIADPKNEVAVSRIFSMKRRPVSKPVGLFVGKEDTVRRIAELPVTALRALAEGSTVVVRRKEAFAMGVGTKETLALRIPKNEFLLEILEAFGGPIAQTSSNTSGEDPARNAREVNRAFGNAGPDIVCEGAPGSATPSAIIDYTKEPPEILRRGEPSI